MTGRLQLPAAGVMPVNGESSWVVLRGGCLSGYSGFTACYTALVRDHPAGQTSSSILSLLSPSLFFPPAGDTSLNVVCTALSRSVRNTSYNLFQWVELVYWEEDSVRDNISLVLRGWLLTGCEHRSEIKIVSYRGFDERVAARMLFRHVTANLMKGLAFDTHTLLLCLNLSPPLVTSLDRW